MKARWSPVIKRNRKTITLSKEVDGSKMTKAQIVKLIEAELEKGKKKKPAKKKAPAKKKTVSKKK